jgi:hypothetical protein
MLVPKVTYQLEVQFYFLYAIQEYGHGIFQEKEGLCGLLQLRATKRIRLYLENNPFSCHCLLAWYSHIKRIFNQFNIHHIIIP